MYELLSLLALGAVFFALHTVHARYRGGLSAVPGPFSASMSNFWKVKAVWLGDMPRRNIEVHRKYGPVVRIGPNHVSFSSPEALHTIHGSRQAYPKSDFYKPTSTPFDGAPLFTLFSVQDVNYHSSLKKSIGGLYTKAVVLGLEPKVDECLRAFTDKISKLIREGEPTPLDMSSWAHYFAFDCLGELTASKKFGFLQKGQDVNGMIAGSDNVLLKTGFFAQAPILQFARRVMEAPTASKAVDPVMTYASSIVRDRLEKPTPTTDMLNNFIHLQQSQPDRLSTREIIGALYINLMAGHDVLAVTLRSVLYHVARAPQVEKKLRSELATLETNYPISVPVPFSALQELPYLDAVIQESLRIHGNLGLVNERVTPPEGAFIDGYHIPGGTIVGINPWVIHRNAKIFGDDVDDFRPERWLDGDGRQIAEMRRNLFSFGAGPRMCIGKNIATMQLFKFISEFYRHFEAQLAHPEKEWHVIGNWVTKQTQMDMLLKQVEPLP
ncbi:benzoate 4-monooxygenase cytochrome P450 [Nemania serpens]|nr:benzoate 4-monooxygenase cytochrome P450 [Nemania serpens]